MTSTAPAEPRAAGEAEPYLAPTYSYAEIGDRVEDLVLAPRGRLGWWLGLFFAFGLAMVLLLSITVVLAVGVGCRSGQE